MALPFQDVAVLFGDSITSRQDVPSSFQSLMSENYRRTLDILNRGFGGYTTSTTRVLFDKIFAPKSNASQVPQIRLVTIWLGTNDSCLPNTSGQHVPLEEYKSHLEYFLHCLTSPESPFAVAHSPLSIVLITPVAMSWSTLDPGLKECRDQKVTKQYVDVVNELVRDWRDKGKQKGKGEKWVVEGIDMWNGILDDADGDEKKLETYFTDGLHLSSAGYAVLWKEYKKLVKGPLRGRGLDWEDLKDCPMRAPDWSNVDPTRPQSVIDGMQQAPFRES